MMKKLKIVLIFILLLLSTGCSLFSGAGKYLGDTYTSTSGGYVLRLLKDYEFQEAEGIITMVAPGGDTDKGPVILAIGGLVDKTYTNEELLEDFLKESSYTILGDTKKLKIDNFEGLVADISSVNYEYELTGKIFVANPYPYQPFALIGFSTLDEWQNFEPIMDAVLKSVEFFEVGSAKIEY